MPMSLRYAHVAPDQAREALAKLNERPILALTLRLPWTAFPAYGSNYLKEMVEREESIPACKLLVPRSVFPPGDFYTINCTSKIRA